MAREKPDKLLVRSDYITRCKWCGTPHSPQWVGTESGNIYCSYECQSADRWNVWGGGKEVGICIIILGNFIVLFTLVASPAFGALRSSIAELFLLGLFTSLLGFFVMISAGDAQSYKDRRDRYSNTELLVCEYCNHINTPGVVACDNCGATLVGARFAIDSWPEWFGPPPEHRKRYAPCRNCGKVFKHASLSADGKHRCPRCGKPV